MSQERYVALLGSINVGGNRLKMADLREALEREDFADVETVVASGNVLFSHDERPSEGLAEKIRWKAIMTSRLDLPRSSFCRTENPWCRLLPERPLRRR